LCSEPHLTLICVCSETRKSTEIPAKLKCILQENAEAYA
jgi:acyl-CoA thioesterase FadM